MWPRELRGWDVLVCDACGAGCLAADALAALWGEPDPAEDAPPEHGYPTHYPQEDAGHVAARGRPTFGPTWGLGPRSADADAAGLLRGR